jgi:predicted branched-subunit amino acid permease
VLASTLLVWAGPAQVILISTAHAGATLLESALAVTLSAIRLLPMVVSVLPMLRTSRTPLYRLALPAHFIAVTVWVESFRLLPHVPRERRIAFVNGLGGGLVLLSSAATAIGYGLAASLPPLLAAAILALTPLTFLLSTARNAQRLVDKLALALGLALYPLVSLLHTGVDILICGVAAGTIAYGVHRLRRPAT